MKRKEKKPSTHFVKLIFFVHKVRYCYENTFCRQNGSLCGVFCVIVVDPGNIKV